MKVNNKKNNLKDDILIEVTGKKIQIKSKISLKKRYLKYLMKKFLKKMDVLDYLKVIAADKKSYVIKYIKVGENAEEQIEKWLTLTFHLFHVSKLLMNSLYDFRQQLVGMLW